MAKSIEVIPKKRGRPATGKDPLLTIRAPAELIASIEAWAEREGLSRSDAVRQLIEAGLAKLSKRGK